MDKVYETYLYSQRMPFTPGTYKINGIQSVYPEEGYYKNKWTAEAKARFLNSALNDLKLSEYHEYLVREINIIEE